MHAHLIMAVVELTERQGIVKVLGIFRVNGTGPYIPEVLALLHILSRDLARNLIGSFLHTLRVFIRQAILCENSVHLHIIVTCLAEHVDHLTDDVLILVFGPFEHFDNNLIISLRTLCLLTRNDDATYHIIALRHTIGHIMIHTHTSDKLILGSLENLNHLCLLDMLLPAGHETHTHPVASQRTHGIALSYKDRLILTVRNE